MTNRTSAYFTRLGVTLNGSVEDGIANNLITALIEETVIGLYRCELTLNNYGAADGGFGYLFQRRGTVDFGKEIGVTVSTGPNDEAALFSGRITGIEGRYPAGGGATLTLLAEDRLQDLRLTRRTRTFEDLSPADVINTIARDHGLSPDVQMGGGAQKIIAQANQSDLAFVRDLARRGGAEVWLDGSTLHVAARDSRSGETVMLEYGVSLLSFSVLADLAHQATEVQVSGWDVAAKDAISETGGTSAIQSELNGGTAGGDILSQSFAARTEVIAHQTPLTGDEAAAIAKAGYRERARRFITGRGQADGDARIRAGTTIELSGLGALFDGDYYVTRVLHTYDSSDGFQTEFDVERAGL